MPRTAALLCVSALAGAAFAGALVIAFAAGLLIGVDTAADDKRIADLELETGALMHWADRRHLVDKVKSRLLDIRFAVAFYQIEHGYEYPDFAMNGWSELIDGSYLGKPPRNPLSPDDVATKLVVVDEVDVTLRDVPPEIAGWVWYSAQSLLLAAGFDEYGLVFEELDGESDNDESPRQSPHVLDLSTV